MAQPRSKPWSQFPHEPNLSSSGRQCMDWVVTQLNQLIGQGNVPPDQSLASFGTNVIDPTTAQIISKGSRTAALATGIQAVLTTSSAAFYWDGSNGSVPFQIRRDDGSTFGPFITDSGLTVGGLTPNTLYFFYPYFDEAVQRIKFVTVAGVAVGTPALAFTAQSIDAAHQQILRGRMPLAALLSSNGVTTTGAGTITVRGGSGGAGSGLGGNGKYAP